MKTRRFKLELAYDGTDFHGWQEQQHEVSVAGSLKQALERILDHPVKLVGAGRTDAGVHALGQTAHCDTHTPRSCDELWRGLNGMLPASIRVRAVSEAPAEFHARYAARSKEYRYQLWDDVLVPPFLARWVWWKRRRLDQSRMAEAAAGLVGTHDFTSFQASGCVAESPVRSLEDASVARHGGMLVVRLVSRGFLRHMARNIVGALVEVGRGRTDAQQLAAILEARDRRQAPATAPARGLFLVRVDYAERPSESLEGPPEPVVTCFSSTTGA
jgi:tRNA pseudouridine38-40 synthase